MAHLLRTRYRDSEKIILVCNNLNAHTRRVFYKAFSAEETRELVKRIECADSPVSRRRKIGDIETLQEETKAWSSYQNKNQRGVGWQFKIDDARSKLKFLYSKSKS